MEDFMRRYRFACLRLLHIFKEGVKKNCIDHLSPPFDKMVLKHILIELNVNMNYPLSRQRGPLFLYRRRIDFKMR